MNELLISFIVCHGYFDILYFKDKIKSSFYYILIAVLHYFLWKLYPTLVLFSLIINTYIHFNNDSIYLFGKYIHYAIPLFIGTMTGKQNMDVWKNSLTIIGLNNCQQNNLIKILNVVNWVYLLINTNNVYNFILMSYIILISCILGTYNTILLYMLVHSSLNLYITTKNYFNHPINYKINYNRTNIYYLISIAFSFNVIIYYSNILHWFSLQTLIDIAVCVLIPHLYLHNFGLLNDIDNL